MRQFPDQYKSARLIQGKVTISLLKFPQEKLKQNSIVLKPVSMGICRADVKEVIGSRDIPNDRGPLFGHELLAKVVYAGKNTSYKDNQLVTFNPNVTPNRTTGFAEYFFIEGDKNILNEALIPIPNFLSVEPPWTPEPFACIVHSTNKLLELLSLPDFVNKTVAIIGTGNSGMMFGLLIKYLNGKVKLFNRGDQRIQFVKTNKLFDGAEIDNLANTFKYKDFFDIVIIVPTIITEEVLYKGFELIKDGGCLHLYGGTRKGDKFLNTQADIDVIRRNETKEKKSYRDKTVNITGAYGCSRADFEEGFKLIRKTPNCFPLDRLISKIISLEELPILIMSMASGEKDYPGKVLVKTF